MGKSDTERERERVVESVKHGERAAERGRKWQRGAAESGKESQRE